MANITELEQQAVSALAAALIADPFYAMITLDFATDEVKRRAVLSEYCHYSLQEGYQIGRVVILEHQPQGAAIWNLPQVPEVAEQSQRAKYAAFAALLGPRGFAHYRAILSFMEPTAHAVIPAEAWYLSILGVDPQLQGHGLGRTLLAPTLQEADQQSVPCYLETFSESARRFYQRCGFHAVGEHVEPTINERYWIMLRNP